jgi:hypothetical protein
MILPTTNKIISIQDTEQAEPEEQWEVRIVIQEINKMDFSYSNNSEDGEESKYLIGWDGGMYWLDIESRFICGIKKAPSFLVSITELLWHLLRWKILEKERANGRNDKFSLRPV